MRSPLLACYVWALINLWLASFAVDAATSSLQQGRKEDLEVFAGDWLIAPRITYNCAALNSWENEGLDIRRVLISSSLSRHVSKCLFQILLDVVPQKQRRHAIKVDVILQICIFMCLQVQVDTDIFSVRAGNDLPAVRHNFYHWDDAPSLQ